MHDRGHAPADLFDGLSYDLFALIDALKDALSRGSAEIEAADALAHAVNVVGELLPDLLGCIHVVLVESGFPEKLGRDRHGRRHDLFGRLERVAVLVFLLLWLLPLDWKRDHVGEERQFRHLRHQGCNQRGHDNSPFRTHCAGIMSDPKSGAILLHPA